MRRLRRGAQHVSLLARWEAPCGMAGPRPAPPLPRARCAGTVSLQGARALSTALQGASALHFWAGLAWPLWAGRVLLGRQGGVSPVPFHHLLLQGRETAHAPFSARAQSAYACTPADGGDCPGLLGVMMLTGLGGPAFSHPRACARARGHTRARCDGCAAGGDFALLLACRTWAQRRPVSGCDRTTCI